MITYEKNEFGIHQRDAQTGEVLRYIDKIGIWYSLPLDEDEHQIVTLHKHGEYEKVKTHMEEETRKYQENGLADMANHFRLIDATQVPMEKINRILEGCGLTKKNFEHLVPIDIESSIIPPPQKYVEKLQREEANRKERIKSVPPETRTKEAYEQTQKALNHLNNKI